MQVPKEDELQYRSSQCLCRRWALLSFTLPQNISPSVQRQQLLERDQLIEVFECRLTVPKIKKKKKPVLLVILLLKSRQAQNQCTGIVTIIFCYHSLFSLLTVHVLQCAQTQLSSRQNKIGLSKVHHILLLLYLLHVYSTHPYNLYAPFWGCFGPLSINSLFRGKRQFVLYICCAMLCLREMHRVLLSTRSLLSSQRRIRSSKSLVAAHSLYVHGHSQVRILLWQSATPGRLPVQRARNLSIQDERDRLVHSQRLFRDGPHI